MERADWNEAQTGRTVTGMAEYIDKEALCHWCLETGPCYCDNCVMNREGIPAADVREVVLCGECYLHTHCRTEDVFDFAGLREENRFCSVGKRKTNSAKMEVQDG